MGGCSSTTQLTAPADGLITNDDTPTFTWGRLSGANPPTSYKIQVDNSGSGFPSPEVDQSVAQPGSGGSVSFTPSSLAFGTYTWRVQGINIDGSGPFSTTRTVTVAPFSPTLSSPANSATTNDQTPTFTWNRVQVLLRTSFKSTLVIVDPLAIVFPQ